MELEHGKDGITTWKFKITHSNPMIKLHFLNHKLSNLLDKLIRLNKQQIAMVDSLYVLKKSLIN